MSLAGYSIEVLVRNNAIVLVAGVLTAAASPVSGQVGFTQFQLPASSGGRALDVAVWYLTTAQGSLTIVGQNAVFVGDSVRVDAPVSAGRHALVLLSHGYHGNWTNQGWLAVELARRGYIVAAVNHPGTTTRDMDAAVGAQLWERPRDLSRTIDALTHDPRWSAALSGAAVAAIGHSLGGWTVVELAGGRFDPERFEADCKDHGGLASCQTYRELGAGRDSASRAALGQSLKDPRIRAVVSLDLGLARGFDPGSLAGLDAPVLVITAGTPNSQIPAALESRHLLASLPSATTHYVELTGAAHFSFLPICRPGSAELLAKDSPDDAVVCRDGEGADREALHRQIATEVIHFLAGTLPPNR